MITSVPRLSVVMPVWNVARFLHTAIDSVLRQSFDAFELIVVDDGSSDRTADALKEYRDPRVIVVRNERRQGLVRALTVAMGVARGEYIARMDGDDVAHPDRFAAQLRFLDGNREVTLVGSWANVIDGEGRVVTVVRVPTSPREIYEALLNSNVFIHSSVMFRKQAVLSVGGYQRIRPDADAAQDYHLWLRLSDRYQLANLPQVLVDYRIHDGQVSMQRLAEQRRSADLARQMAAKRRAGHGEPRRTPSGLRLMEKLRGIPGTLGGDYLFFCDLYRTADKRDIAFRLARQAVLRSPLSRQAWDRAIRESARQVLGPASIRVLRAWLARRG